MIRPQRRRQPPLKRPPPQRRIDHRIAVRGQIAQSHQIALRRQRRRPLQHFLARQVGAAGKLGRPARPPLLRHADHHILAGPLVQQHQPFRHLRVKAAVAPARVRVYHLPPAQSAFGGAHHEIVALDHRQRLRQQQLHPALGPRLQPLGVQQPRPGRRLAGEQVKGDPFVMLQRMGRIAHHSQAGVNPLRRTQPARRRQDFPAPDVIAGYPRQVHRQPHPRLGAANPRLVALQPADPRPLPGAGHFDLLPHRQRTVNQRPGDHRAEARYGKAAVNRQPRAPQIAPRLGVVQNAVNPLAQFIHPGAGVSRYPHHRAARERRPRQRILHLRLDQLHQFIIRQVGLGHHHQPAGHPQNVQDCQMLPGLRHNAFIGRHDEQGQINPPHPRQHILDKPLMPRHIHNTNFPSARQRHPRKAQINGHLPLLLLREPVGINIGKRLNQRRLAMVHVPGRANYIHTFRPGLASIAGDIGANFLTVAISSRSLNRMSSSRKVNSGPSRRSPTDV